MERQNFEEIFGLVKEMVDTGGKCCNPWITCNKKTIFHGNEKKGGKGLIGLTPLKKISDKSPILKIGICKAI